MAQKPQDDMHPEDQRNMILFVICALAIWFSFDHFLLKPRLDALKQAQVAQQETAAQSVDSGASLPAVERARDQVLADSPRLAIKNDHLHGSLALKGARLDDLSLNRYYKTIENKDNVVLLSPAGAAHAEYAEFGWIASGSNSIVPDENTQWAVKGGDAGATLAPNRPITLIWNNGQGLTFEQEYSLDDKYMFTIKQRVINSGATSVTLHPFSLATQRDLPEEFYGHGIVHEGPIGYVGEKLIQHPYAKLLKGKDKPEDVIESDKGWIGITDKYWLTGIIPAQAENSKFRFVYTPAKDKNDKPRFQTDLMGAARTIAPAASTEYAIHLFAGAKEIDTIEMYEKAFNIPHFDLTVDFGLYYFLTRPLSFVLNFLAGHLSGVTSHPFGIALLILTVMVRACVFPLANFSFRSFASLSKISPQMKEIREKFGDDRAKLQEALMHLYEKEKVNPMAGCLPILVQIPIFFALYKVLSVTIEMRHAPFFGWIHDMSAPDPTTVFNLFGLINWTPPSFLRMFGGWSCLMLVFLLIQKQLNPPPPTIDQAFMMTLMPFVMTWVMAGFAAGLVIYWTFGNMLSIIQQAIIMRSMGVDIYMFNRKKMNEKIALQKEEAKKAFEEKQLSLLKNVSSSESVSLESDTTAEEKDPVVVSMPKPKRKTKK
jgi:YidC/Oxa1 family membrane protein insertase